jgi:hypothetical protein
MIIAANSEDAAVKKAVAQMGNAARVEFTRTVGKVTP